VKVAGGILSILSGIPILLIGVYTVYLGGFTWLVVGLSAAVLAVTGIVWLVLGILAIVGGAVAIAGKARKMALTGSICAVVAPIWYYNAIIILLPILLMGILSTVFVVLSRDSYEKNKPDISESVLNMEIN
jgi:hypothetical protein